MPAWSPQALDCTLPSPDCPSVTPACPHPKGRTSRGTYGRQTGPMSWQIAARGHQGMGRAILYPLVDTHQPGAQASSWRKEPCGSDQLLPRHCPCLWTSVSLPVKWEYGWAAMPGGALTKGSEEREVEVRARSAGGQRAGRLELCDICQLLSSSPEPNPPLPSWRPSRRVGGQGG